PERLTVQAGDRLRTNDSGAARLSLTAATIADVGPATCLLVERLESGPDGGVGGALLLVGGTVAYYDLDSTGSVRLEVTTPAARAGRAAGAGAGPRPGRVGADLRAPGRATAAAHARAPGRAACRTAPPAPQ